MRLLFAYDYIFGSADGANGVSIQICGLMQFLQETGHVVSLYNPDSAAAVRKGFLLSNNNNTSNKIHHIQAPIWKVIGTELPFLAPLTEWNVLSRTRPDIVVIENTCINAVSLATLCRLRGIPCTIFAHTNVVDYLRIRTSSCIQSNSNSSASWDSFLFWKVLLWLIHAYLHCFLRIPMLSPSVAMKSSLRDWGMLGRNTRVEIVAGGADDNIFRPPPQQPQQQQRTRKSLLYVGRVTKEKNIDQLLEIMRQLLLLRHSDDTTDTPDTPMDDASAAEKHITTTTTTPSPPQYTLTMVGKVIEEDFGSLEEFSRMVPPNVTVLGELPHGPKLAQLYNSHEAFLFASEFDTFGNVIVEAMLSGCIPIVKDCLGPGEIVEHGISGFKWKTTAEAIQAITTQSPRPHVSDVLARGQQFTLKKSHEAFIRACEHIIGDCQ